MLGFEPIIHQPLYPYGSGIARLFPRSPYIEGDKYKVKDAGYGLLKFKNKETNEKSYRYTGDSFLPVYQYPVGVSYTVRNWNATLVGVPGYSMPRGTMVQNPRTLNYVHVASQEGREIKLFYFIKRNMRNAYTEGKGAKEIYVFRPNWSYDEKAVSAKEVRELLKKYDV